MHVMVNSIFENLLFYLYFLNKDISFNIPCTFLKFGIHTLECQLAGSMSQIFYLGPSFHLSNLKKKV